MRRVYGWIPTVWLLFVIIRYSLNAFRTVVPVGCVSFNCPDANWAKAWFVFVAVAAILTAFLRSFNLSRFWLAVAITTTLSVLILSQEWIPGLIALLILLIAHGVGEFILQCFAVKHSAVWMRLLVTVPAGIGLLALAQFAIAVSGHFNKATSWMMLATFAIPAAIGLRSVRFSWTKVKSALDVHPMLAASVTWIWVLNLTWATAPEMQYDPTSVHLAVPRLYLEHGGVVDLPYFFHSYFVHLLDMFFGLCLSSAGLTGGPIVAKLVILAMGLVAACGVFAIGGELFSPEVGAWAAVIFYSTPLVIWLSSTTYLDLAETGFILASITAFIRWFESGEVGWLVMSALTAGVAIGTKLHALTLLTPIPLAVVWYAAKRYSRPLRQVLIYVLLALVIAAPWYVVIYRFTGNPVYPFMNALFKSPQWEIENTRLNADSFGIGTSARSLLRLPFRFVWNTDLFAEAVPRGAVGVGLLLGFPLIFVRLSEPRWWRSPLMRILVCCMALHAFVWAVSFQYYRYFIPGLPFWVIFGCGVFLADRYPWTFWNRALLFLVVMIQVPVSSTLFRDIAERFPLDHALGRETDDHFLSRALGGYRGTKFLNSVTRPGDQILSVNVENLRFYIRAPLQSLSETPSVTDWRRKVGEDPSPDNAAALFKDLGFRYAISPVADFEKPALWMRWLQPTFRERFEREIYRDDSVVILKLCYDACAFPAN